MKMTDWSGKGDKEKNYDLQKDYNISYHETPHF
jgi:hypothetical protein